MKLWDISKILYREILFKSVTETTVRKKPEDLVKSVNSYMWLNKTAVAMVLSVISLFIALNPTVFACSVFLANLLFMFVFFFLQIVTSFVSNSFDYLHVLPLSQRDISKIRMLTFLRIFDLPLFAVALASLSVFGLFVSPFSAFWALLGVITAELLAVAIVFRLARFFYSKIAYSTGGWKTLLRMFYMIAWSVSAFGFYILVIFMMEIPNMNIDLKGWDFVFPVCFGCLMSGSFSYIALISSLTYLTIAVVLFNKTLSIINEKVVVTMAKTRKAAEPVQISMMIWVLFGSIWVMISTPIWPFSWWVYGRANPTDKMAMNPTISTDPKIGWPIYRPTTSAQVKNVMPVRQAAPIIFSLSEIHWIVLRIICISIILFGRFIPPSKRLFIINA